MPQPKSDPDKVAALRARGRKRSGDRQGNAQSGQQVNQQGQDGQQSNAQDDQQQSAEGLGFVVESPEPLPDKPPSGVRDSPPQGAEVEPQSADSPPPPPGVESVSEAVRESDWAQSVASNIGGRTTAIMRSAVDYVRTHNNTSHGQTMLDETIMTMRQSGLSHRRIAAELGGAMSEEDVIERLAMMYAKMESVTTTEYRMLQVARLEGVINMCYALAEQGSADHIDLLLKAIERLNKMFELETERSKIEVEIITDAQAVMLLGVVTGVLEILMRDDRITNAIPDTELKSITATALDAAEQMIIDDQGQTVTMNLR